MLKDAHRFQLRTLGITLSTFRLGVLPLFFPARSLKFFCQTSPPVTGLGHSPWVIPASPSINSSGLDDNRKHGDKSLVLSCVSSCGPHSSCTIGREMSQMNQKPVTHAKSAPLVWHDFSYSSVNG